MAIEDRLAMLEQRVAMLEHRLSLQGGAVAQDPWSPIRPMQWQHQDEEKALIRPEAGDEEDGGEEWVDLSDEEQSEQEQDDGYDPELDKKARPVLSDFKNPLPRAKAQSAVARIVLGGSNGLGGSRGELETLQNELWDEAIGDE